MQNTIAPIVLPFSRTGEREAAVVVSRLSHVFGSGPTAKQVLFDVDLRIDRGEIVILMGPSGCGKTTILTLIGALRSVQSGTLDILGQKLSGSDRATQLAIRRRIGFIFQAHNLHGSLTALENIRMGLEAQGPGAMCDAHERCIEMLGSVGLAEKRDAYPENLSGGQKQRIAIARALVARPALVLADEPTAALDKTNGRQVVDLLHDLAKQQGSAILMVTHDNRILDIADRIFEMEDGRIVRAAKGGW